MPPRMLHLLRTAGAACLLAANGLAADDFAASLRQGEPHLLFNPRYEYGKIDGFEAGHALTLKTLLGYTTADWNGWLAKVEFTDTRVADRDAYNAAGLHGPAEKTLIADPATTELNQLYLRYQREGGSGTLGRQRYILDNARFVGNVGWRQNEQTFDALTLALEPVEKLTLHLGFLDHINRIFADQRDWDSESVVVNGQYALSPATSFTAYYYHLDFDGAVVTTDTVGGIFNGSTSPHEGLTVGYRAELAYQSYDASPIETHYYHLRLDAAYAGLSLAAGYEVLGSDAGAGQFLTPLATAHAFNGFADTYLDNGGAGGLRDLYFSAGGALGAAKFTAVYHFFESDEGDTADGRELDVVATYPITDWLTGLAKVAFYQGEVRADRERFILQLTAKF